MKKKEINTEKELINRISLYIIIFAPLLYLQIIGHYLTFGLSIEEFSSFITIISPVLTVYLGAYVKYTIAHREIKEETKKEVLLDKNYIRLTLWVIPFHFLFLSAMIILKTLNQINFETANLIIGFTEGAFGVYIGMIVSDLFKVENK